MGQANADPIAGACLAPATLDAMILQGLRRCRGPVAAGELAYRLQLDGGTTSTERQDAIDRLIARGLVERQTVRLPHPRRPLLDWTEQTLYRAIGGGL